MALGLGLVVGGIGLGFSILAAGAADAHAKHKPNGKSGRVDKSIKELSKELSDDVKKLKHIK